MGAILQFLFSCREITSTNRHQSESLSSNISVAKVFRQHLAVLKMSVIFHHPTLLQKKIKQSFSSLKKCIFDALNLHILIKNTIISYNFMHITNLKILIKKYIR